MALKADSGSEKLRRIQAVTDSALSKLEFSGLLTELLERTCDLLHAHLSVILLLDATGSELVVTASAGAGESVLPDARVQAGQGLVGQVVAQAQSRTSNHSAADGSAETFLQRGVGVTFAAAVPIVASSRVTGVVYAGNNDHPFGPDDLELLHLVADRASLAVQARLSESDRAATLALQRSLLPARPSPVPGLDVAARYIPGAEIGVGGDWYDLFALPSGHVGLVIGDVAGNGLHAAIIMGRIRSALRAYALESTDPADVLSRLDRKIQLFEPGALATAVYAVVDPARTTVTFSTAGHLFPIIIPARSPARFLKAPIDVPLGAYPEAVRHTTTAEIDPGTGLLFYTDGLVERRGHSLTSAVAALRDSLTSSAADAVCQQAIEHMHDSTVSDDVALLAVRRHQQVSTLE